MAGRHFARAPGKPWCRYGNACYQKNPQHWLEFDHDDTHPHLRKAAADDAPRTAAPSAAEARAAASDSSSSKRTRDEDAATAASSSDTDEDEVPPATPPAAAAAAAAAAASSSSPGSASCSLSMLCIFVWNAGSVCPQAALKAEPCSANKLTKIAPLLESDDPDLILLPEASISNAKAKTLRRKQLEQLEHFPGYRFHHSKSGKMAAYVKNTLAATTTVRFPESKALLGSLAIVEDTSGAWAAVGLYAPNMTVPNKKKETPGNVEERRAFDEALFVLLEELSGVPTVALVGDLNIVWEAKGGGKHGELRERWKAALGRLGFGEPLDEPGPDGKVVATHIAYPRNGAPKPPPARVDFLFVRSSAGDGAVDSFGRHGDFRDHHGGEEKLSEHTPLWLRLNV